MTLLNTAFAGGAAIMVPLAGVLRRSVRVAHGDPVDGRIRGCADGAGDGGDTEPAGGHRAAAGRGTAGDGRRGRGRGQRIEPVYSESDFTLRQAIATPAFWLMTAAVTLRIAAADALVINQIPMLVWKGIPEEQAAFFLSATFLVIIPLRFAMGLGAMVIPSRWLLFGGMTVGAVAAILFLTLSGYPAAAMFVLSVAATEGIATLGWLAVGEYFGRRSFGSLVGIMTVSFGVGSLVAPVAAGWVFDQTGEYGIALAVAAVMQLGSGVCYLMARRPGGNLQG